MVLENKTGVVTHPLQALLDVSPSGPAAMQHTS